MVGGHFGGLLLYPTWTCKSSSWAEAGKPLAVFPGCVIDLKDATKMGVVADTKSLATGSLCGQYASSAGSCPGVCMKMHPPGLPIAPFETYPWVSKKEEECEYGSGRTGVD